MITITKESVRKLTRSKRLPKKFRMFVPGCWLLDVLKENSLENIRLWNQTYWVSCRSMTPKQLAITWRIEK